jgi:hypothetical protein
MQAGSAHVRAIAVSSLALLLSACAGAGFPEFGSNACRTVYVLSGGVVQPVNSCGGIPREGLMAQKSVAVVANDLPALLAAPKFEPDAYYTGVATLADKPSLTKIVDDAVRALIAMPEPRDAMQVRQRLQLAIQAVAGFPAEDRNHAHMYLILAWRAAGFAFESGLFPTPDEQVLTAS